MHVELKTPPQLVQLWQAAGCRCRRRADASVASLVTRSNLADNKLGFYNARAARAAAPVRRHRVPVDGELGLPRVFHPRQARLRPRRWHPRLSLLLPAAAVATATAAATRAASACVPASLLRVRARHAGRRSSAARLVSHGR